MKYVWIGLLIAYIASGVTTLKGTLDFCLQWMTAVLVIWLVLEARKHKKAEKITD